MERETVTYQTKAPPHPIEGQAYTTKITTITRRTFAGETRLWSELLEEAIGVARADGSVRPHIVSAEIDVTNQTARELLDELVTQKRAFRCKSIAVWDGYAQVETWWRPL